MTTQEAYEQIREFFSRPDAKIAYDAKIEKCRYRVGEVASAPVRCAVGCLIPDAEYDPGFEDQALGDVLADVPSLVYVNSDFLQSAQYEHDDAPSPADFVLGLDELADRYGLEVVQ